MSNLELGFWSFPILLVMVFLRAPIGLAMLLCGFGGWFMAMGGNPTPLLAKLKSETYTTFSSYSLTIIPLFLLMGQFATLSGMSQALFRAAESFLGHRRGGVAMAAVGACAGFGAICGSSLATAATMSKVALPELKRYGYSGGFSTATLAAGGTLGILIPPSVILVIYAILTEQNIAKLFLAAFIPGILAAIGYVLTISIYVRLHPDAAGTRPPVPMAERFAALSKTWPVIAIFFLVVGGIYLGWFTPTEAAAVGAAGTGLVALLSGSLGWDILKQSLIGTARTTAMIFFIVLGAGFYNGFLALSGVPQFMADWVVTQGLSPWLVLTIILVFYLIFGCLMDSLSMILLTVPIFFPVISAMDFGMSAEHVAIWFGILVLIVVEVGLITPPVGMNLFIINSMDKETPMTETYKTVMYFVGSDIVRVAILVIFPSITLFLLR
ncbi:TRAP transporter large permease [Sulfitobacter donghicola]|uniref:TRAP transporter large permease protein n=1 Tax=Sulfitobacter donghicola DSW-25 = KCTC 12864 = JCM 14565 TaxID=1300350 RepID=A0A073IMH5_9RHOB|nr:TRAP transporter large permease [Sulfitobacter donghicola]KEJ90949.1 C4-dicarboxylate ABC transporter permease [Sulfitobacter donghicola DSW-25 = KCTC 12864 = JCM 14565]KIN68239.1 TRAP dicarboxylate transporter, permease component [Sulfitobacter donghicola DSW-25 = KCTC 12864 = JCM 14565]